MVVASEAQHQTIAPVMAYFDRKHREREDRDVADKRFIASVLELVRAEGRDQEEWRERRRCRMGTRGDSKKPKSVGLLIRDGSSKPLEVEGNPHRCRQQHRQQQQRSPTYRPGRKENSSEGSEERNKMNIKDTLDPTQAMIRIGRLKPTMGKSVDPPSVAAELAMLYLVLSDQKGALKSFQLAAKPSPKRAPTKEETDQREMQERRLMLMNKDRRAEELAKLAAQDVARELERAVAERARRKHATTGIYRCLLELKQPVQAAQAARSRLAMCETKEERRQVEIEIHETLLEYDGLLESAATNQGAWLKESAGALTDLHAAVLENLTGFSMVKISTASSTFSDSFFSTKAEASASAVGTGSPGTDIGCDGGDLCMNGRGSDAGADGSRESIQEQGGDKRLNSSSAFVNVAGSAVCGETVSAIGSKRRDSADVGRDEIATTVTSRRKSSKEEQPERRRRSRLRNLGLLLARKRRFTSSRQAFEDAVREGPEERLLRERNRGYSPGFFLDLALEEELPKIGLNLDSRWQGGVEADENSRRALADFTGFTGLHRGAETLVTALPPAGWAASGDATEIAYSEGLSESRPTVLSLQQHQPKKKWGLGLEDGIPGEAARDSAGVFDISRGKGGAVVAVSTATSGLMLRHVVPAEDVVYRDEPYHRVGSDANPR